MIDHGCKAARVVAVLLLGNPTHDSALLRNWKLGLKPQPVELTAPLMIRGRGALFITHHRTATNYSEMVSH